MEQGVTRNMKTKSVRTEVSAPATTAEKGTPGYADTTASSDTASAYSHKIERKCLKLEELEKK